MKNDLSTIALIMPYFGKWPIWFDFFLESCRYNPTIDWIFYTDCGIPANAPDNTIFHEMSFDGYKFLLHQRLGINTEKMTPYKICDFRAAFGYIHQEELKNYDFFGYGDIDLIYGNIRNIITEKILKNNIISTHSDRLSGHFALIGNSEKYRTAFFKIPNWKRLFEADHHIGLDEGAFSRLFRRRKKASKLFFAAMKLLSSYHRNTYFKEQFTTILAPMQWIDGTMEHPKRWFWKNGKLTNEKDGEREFLYLHFMNWKSDQWLSEENKPAKWSQIDCIVNDNFSSEWDGFVIDETGFHKLNGNVRCI